MATQEALHAEQRVADQQAPILQYKQGLCQHQRLAARVSELKKRATDENDLPTHLVPKEAAQEAQTVSSDAEGGKS